MPTNEREPLAGGSLGKLAGRAKEMAGNLLDRRDLGRERRLQRVGVEAEESATAEDRVEARQTDRERQAARAEAAAERLDPKPES
jgi:hypothetical protein